MNRKQLYYLCQSMGINLPWGEFTVKQIREFVWKEFITLPPKFKAIALERAKAIKKNI